MIYTITFNPALDYVVKVEQFTLGEVNRATKETIYYGGKGLNVSAVLTSLGFKNTALGFVAGFTGDEIIRGVKSQGIEADFIKVKRGISRINVKIKSQDESEINGMGPEILPQDLEHLLKKLEGIHNGDVLILSGSIPSSIEDDIYAQIMWRLKGRKIKVIVDATKNLLLKTIPLGPFLIKPNIYELGELFQTEIKREEDIVVYASKLQKKGVANVLVSLGREGAILLAENGKTYKMGVPRGEVKYCVGAGDSMVAGFIAGYLEYGEYEMALRMGIAAGSATAFSEGLAIKEDIIKLFHEQFYG